MNHISWADIPVMMATLDADFVAKADILSWPVLGALARRLDPIFVARDRRSRSQDQADMIARRLSEGRSVILCAEGTTSIGSTVLPFRTSLFAAAQAAVVVQPVLISYRDRNGKALSAERAREVAWIAQDSLLPSAVRLARSTVMASLSFLDPVTGGSGDRKALAHKVREALLVAQAAAPNLPR